MRLKDRKKPKEERAPDTSINPRDCMSKLREAKAKDKGTVALRIDSKTIIQVKRENATETYRKEWMKRMEESKGRTNY